MSIAQTLFSAEDALSIIVQHRAKKMIETRPLDETLNMELATDLVSKVTLPSADVSAMDGYAVKLDEAVKLGGQLRVVGEAAAGAPFINPVGSGEAVRIFTGAIVPTGADFILVQELTGQGRDTGMIKITGLRSEKMHIRKAGQDFSKGDIVLEKGVKLGPAEIGVAAAANHAKLPVLKPLRVAILTNGNELRWPGAPLQVGELINSNAFSIAALCRVWGAAPIVCDISKDEVDSILDLIANVDEPDIIVTVGGASVGDRDLIKTAMDRFGVKRLFDRVALKPGKPTWFGMAENIPVLGLPGNPVAAYVGAQLFLAPLLRVFDNFPVHSAIAGDDLSENGIWESFVRAKAHTENGLTYITPLSKQDTSLTRSLVQSNCLLRRAPNEGPIRKGNAVSIIWTRQA